MEDISGEDNEQEKRILILEGSDDYHFMYHFQNAHKLQGKFSRMDGGGINELLKILPIYLKPGGAETIGIVVDADSNLKSRWTSLRDRLITAGFKTVPKLTFQDGCILEQERLPRVGIWIMPDNQLPGMLEDFVIKLIPKKDPLWDRAQQAVADIPTELRKFNAIQKAEIHTWLAWQKYPGIPMGEAIKRHYLSANVAEAQPFVNWLKKLFVDQGVS